MDLTKALDWLFPRKCAFCGRVNLSDLPCETCQKTLPWLVGDAARSQVEWIDTTVSALGYQGAVRDGVLALKFGGKLARAKALGLLTAQCAADHLPQSFDFISYPPLSAKRRRQRGYDQAQRLAREVAKARGMEETALFVKEDRPAQSGLTDRSARRANVLGAYRLPDPERVKGKTVLLVDDVVTTGATLSECARVLRTAGAKQVCAVTLAKAGNNQKE